MHFNGVPAVVIAAWLGHTDARFTLSVYAHSTNAALTDAATTLGEVVSGNDSAAGQQK
jgi:integrase